MHRSDIDMLGLLEQWNHTVIDDTLNMTCRDWVAPFQNKTNCDISETELCPISHVILLMRQNVVPLGVNFPGLVMIIIPI